MPKIVEVATANPRRDLAIGLAAIRRPPLVLAGERDESFYAERCRL